MDIKINKPAKLKEELEKMTKEQLVELIKKQLIDVKNPQNKTKEVLIRGIVSEYKDHKKWSEYYDHDYYFEL
jgi:hypothetical protein